MIRLDDPRMRSAEVVFQAVVELPPEQRPAALDEQCGSDLELRAFVERLLRCDESWTDEIEGRLRFRPPAGPQPPFKIGRFRVLRTLGEGGMGVVYEAEQEHPRRPVALKIMRFALPSRELVQRFAIEAEVLGQLNHPGIAQVYEAGSGEVLTADGKSRCASGRLPFVAMELVRGEPLLDFARRRNLSVRERLELAVRVCDAVSHAHKRAVIHRDLKPANILVDESGQPKILDFGVSRVMQRSTGVSETQTAITGAGQLLGTIRYMSPEQLSGDPARVDTRSDVYALGVILYELLAGQPPHALAGLSMPEASRAVCESEPRPLSSLDRFLRGEVETIVHKAMARDKARRYQSAADLADDIRRYLTGEPIEAKRDSKLYVLGKTIQRHRWTVAAVAAVVFALVLGIMGTSWQAVRATRAQVLAKGESERARLINEFLQGVLTSSNQLRPMFLSDASDFAAVQPLRPNPSFREFIDYVAQQIPIRFAAHPEVEAALRHTVGLAYSGMGRFDESETHLRKALEIRQNLLGESDAETRATMGALAHTLTSVDKPDESRRRHERVVTLTREVLGPEDPETLMAASRFAFDLSLAGSAHEGAALARETLSQCRQLLPADHPATLIALWASSNAHRNAGLPLEAETAARELVERAERTLPAEAPFAHAARVMLAWAVDNQGRFEEALRLNRRVVDESLDVWDQNHPAAREEQICLARLLLYGGRRDEALSLIDELHRVTPTDPINSLTVLDSGSISSLLWSTGRRGDAIRRARETIAARQRRFDFPSERTLWVVLTLSRQLAGTGAADEAENLLQSALADCRSVRGNAAADTLTAIEYLVYFLLEQGQPARAEPLQGELVDSLRRSSEGDSIRMEDALWTMGSILAGQHKCDEAEKAYREAYEIAARARGAESWDACYRKSGLAVVLRRCGRLDEAERYGRESVEALRPFAAALPTYFIRAARNYADVLKSAGRLEQAEQILREAVALRSERIGSRGIESISVVSDLVDVLDRLGKPDEAIDLQRQISDSYRGAYGTDHPQALRAQMNLIALRARQSAAGMEEAIEYARSAAAGNDKLSSLDLLRCGEYLVVGDNFKPAAGLIQRAIEKGGRQHWYYKSLGWALLRAGRRDEAHAALQQALEHHDPAVDMSTAKVGHWTAAYLLGQVDQETYVARWQNDSEHYTRYACMTWFYIGQRLEAEGKPEEAIAAYRKSVELGQLPDAFPISHFAAYRLRILGQ